MMPPVLQFEELEQQHHDNSPQCATHANHPRAKVYCSQCSMVFCSDCALVHMLHGALLIETLQKQWNGELKQLEQVTRKRVESVQHAKKELQSQLKQGQMVHCSIVINVRKIKKCSVKDASILPMFAKQLIHWNKNG